MKKMTVVKYLMLLFLISCKNDDKVVTDKIDFKQNQQEDVTTQKNISLDGEWEFIYNPNNDDLPNTVFTLLIQKANNNEFTAQYCAVAQKGNRIDCSNDKEFNVIGVIKGNKIEANFYSFFDNKKTKGNAELMILNSESIQWVITKAPNSEFYAPTKCVLKRKKEVPQVSNKSNSLPFDFDKYTNAKDRSSYKVYSSDEFTEITKIINDQINESPVRFFTIDNGGLPFETYVIETDGDSTTQILVNINNKKILGNEIIGYESDTKNTFIINKDLSVSMYRIGDNNSKKLSRTLQIEKDGSITKK